MASTDPFEPARRRKRGIGWCLVAVGAFFVLREISEGGPITDVVPLATFALAVALVASGWYCITRNAKGDER
jgi:hypothetical protein